jgi:isocitrate dehydrogenase (NAD+)
VGAAIVGGPGLIPGANYGTDCAVFEPGCRHIGMGIQGQNTANPTGLLLSSLQMLNHLGLNDYSDKINNALNNVIREGRVLTPDVGGDHSTTDFTLQIISKLQ